MTTYLLLMAEVDHFANWDAADDALRDRVMADFRAFSQAVGARGSVVGGEALTPSSTARTVRPADLDGARTVTAGPYAETVEQLGGVYLIDVPDLGAAVELAALLPREYAVEVRECLAVEVS